MIFRKKDIKENISDEVNRKERVKRYFFLVVGCFLLAVAFNMFFAPNNLVTGGVSGVSIVVNKVTGLSTTVFIAITSIILLIVSYIVLGKKETQHTIIGSLCYPTFVFLTKDLAKLITINVDEMLLICIFGALIYGIGSGLTFKYGFSSGGTDVICQILSKYFKITIGDSIRIVNTTIILGSGFFIGGPGVVYAWENVMYAIIIVYIVSLLNDKLLLGISDSKAFYVITEHETSVKTFLLNEIGKGVTVVEGRGGYTGDRKKVIMCVVPTRLYFLAKEGILEIDKNAIVLINDVYQTLGIE